MKNPIFFRISQLVSLLLGARIFVLVFFAFTLYVSTFFLFNQEEDLRKFIFDYKVHGIILCAVLSIAAGGIINRFYDREKDQIQKPFRAKLQNFLNEKYFLYSYIALNIITLVISWLLSPRIFIFFLFYQFLIWFYSHKLSKILIVNNLTYVSLSLYPFFGMLIYYQHFSWRLFWMAAFLFVTMLIIDLIKDILTKNVDRVFGYHTISNFFGTKVSFFVVIILMIINALISIRIIAITHNFFTYYFIYSIAFLGLMMFPVLHFKKSRMFWVINFMRIWVFIGVIFMLLNGVFNRL